MKYLIIFLFSFLFAFKNELYLKVIENNIIINFLNSSLQHPKELNINPSIKKIIQTTPTKFITQSVEIDTKGNKQASIGLEFDFQKNNKQIIILTSNKEIFTINKIFEKNRKIIECYKNRVLFNLKLYFLKVVKFDNFYSQFLKTLNNVNYCNTDKPITFFKITKEKEDFNIDFNPIKKRQISSKLNINLNQDKETFLSASFSIKIPLEKSYSPQDLNKLQNINNSLNKINSLIVKINNLITSYNNTLKQNRIILNKLKLLTLIAKIAPAKMNYDKLINLYESFFNNLETLNSIEREIFINKFLLKTEKRKISEY